MIGDPLFYQRLLRILQLRGGTPEADPDLLGGVLGTVIAIPASLLLERAGGDPSTFYAASKRLSQAAGGAGFQSFISMVTGWFSTAANFARPYQVDLIYLSITPEQAAHCRLYVQTLPYASTAATSQNMGLNGDLHADIGRQETAGATNLNSPETDDNAIYGRIVGRTRRAANTEWLWDGITGTDVPRALMGGRHDGPGTESRLLRVTVWQEALNAALDAVFWLIYRVTPLT